jgi:endonuclease/exonuclease/phosphatase family metal-dependent hydrolase
VDLHAVSCHKWDVLQRRGLPVDDSRLRAGALVARTLRRTLVALLALLSFVASPGARADTTLTVASYNVFAVPWISPQREQRVATIAKELAALDVDVVGLQELWLVEDAAVVGEALAAAGLIHQRHYGPTGTTRGSGLWIGSRYPILSERFIPFSAGSMPWVPWHLDYLAEKGVAIVAVDTPNGPMTFANTHLQSSYAVGDYRFVQTAQALQLSEELGARGVQPSAVLDPLIMVGDLNVDAASLPARALAARSGLLPAMRDFDLDHVMYRTGARAALRADVVSARLTEPVVLPSGDAVLLSDHPCLVATFSFASCSPCDDIASEPWSLVAGELDADASRASATVRTSRPLHGSGALLGLAAAVMLALGVPRRIAQARRILRGIGAAVALALACWLGYVAVYYAPYEMALIEAQQRAPDGQPAARD